MSPFKTISPPDSSSIFTLHPERESLLSCPSLPIESRWSNWTALGLWCSFLFFYGLAAGELYRTETLRAIVAAEMLRSGNWIVPTLYGEPLLTKPPGMYIAIALMSWPFGHVTEVTARLPSAVAATVTVLLFYWYFGRQLDRRGGLVAALLLPVSLMWLDKAPSAEMDMLQLAWVTASLLFAFRALEARESVRVWERESAAPTPACSPTLLHSHTLTRSRSDGFWWLAALLCVAGGVLTKWTAPVFFYGTLVPLLWWRGRLRILLGRNHLVSAALGAGLCLAWAAAAADQVGWDVFATTVRSEAAQHLLAGANHHAHPWSEKLARPLVALAANLPCAAFALFTLRPGFARRWDERGRRLLQALHCWTWPNLVFWSWCVGHSVRHGFPLAPGLAGLAGLVWVAWLRDAERKSFRRAAACLFGLLAVWLAAKLIFVHGVIPARMAGREPRAKGEQVAALVPAGETLYLFQLKDEGILFYYGRPVRRLPGPADLPASVEPCCCLLTEAEWQRWNPAIPVHALGHFNDSQGDPLVLVQVGAARSLGTLPATGGNANAVQRLQPLLYGCLVASPCTKRADSLALLTETGEWL